MSWSATEAQVDVWSSSSFTMSDNVDMGMFQDFTRTQLLELIYTAILNTAPDTAMGAHVLYIAMCLPLAAERPLSPPSQLRILEHCISFDFLGPFFLNLPMAISGVSALASVFIIVTFWRFSRFRTFAYKVIMMLAVANLFLDCAYLMGNVGHANWRCTLQGFMRVYFALVEFALVTAITLTCYVMIVKPDFRIQERFYTVMAYCWLIPLFMALLPFTTNNYGAAGAWCSITAKDLKSLEWGTFWRFAIIYVPLWVCVAVNAYMCLRVYRALRGYEAAMVAYAGAPDDEGLGDSAVVGDEALGGLERRRSSAGIEMSSSMPIIDRLRLYPIALVVCWSWATVNRVKEALNPHSKALFWLYILQYTFQTTQGFFNLIIFLRTPGVAEEWRDQLQKLMPCQRVRNVDRSSLLTSSRRSDDKRRNVR